MQKRCRERGSGSAQVKRNDQGGFPVSTCPKREPVLWRILPTSFTNHLTRWREILHGGKLSLNWIPITSNYSAPHASPVIMYHFTNMVSRVLFCRLRCHSRDSHHIEAHVCAFISFNLISIIKSHWYIRGQGRETRAAQINSLPEKKCQHTTWDATRRYWKASGNCSGRYSIVWLISGKHLFSCCQLHGEGGISFWLTMLLGSCTSSFRTSVYTEIFLSLNVQWRIVTETLTKITRYIYLF